MLRKSIRSIIELADYKRALFALTNQELKLRYRRTALGYLWTLLNPLLMMTVMTLVFSNLFNSDPRVFAVFLFSGMIPWNFFSTTVISAGGSIILNEGMIKTIFLPKIIFPLSTSIALFIDSLLSFIALFLIIILIGGQISKALLFLPIAFLLIFFFAFGIALFVSVANVFFRDLQHILIIGMQGLFFLSPVLYETRNLSGAIGVILQFNPVVPFIELFRYPIRELTVPPTEVILVSSFLSISSIILGLFVFLKNQDKLVFRL